MQDSRMPARSALIAVCVNIVLNLTLIWFMGTSGLALSTALCSYLQVVILIHAIRKRFGASVLDGLSTILVRTFLATMFMWMVGKGVLLLCRGLPDGTGFDILRLAIVIPLAAGVYALAAKLLRIEMLSLLAGAKRR
jgi:putative peptidoglycan lipid II flippase